MKKQIYISGFVLEYEKYLTCVGQSPVSCSEEEVDEFESMLPEPYRFPNAYKEFLLYGGRKMPGMFGDINFSYPEARFLFKSNYDDVLAMLEGEGCDYPLPLNIFVITERLREIFYFFDFTEGEDPPIYLWQERCGGGLEAAKKEYESFSDFLMDGLRIAWIYLMNKRTRVSLENGQPPRDQQIWYPTKQERAKGIPLKKLKDYFGFAGWQLNESAQKLNLTPEQYLEELSGWEARRVEEEIRFFPPSS